VSTEKKPFISLRNVYHSYKTDAGRVESFSGYSLRDISLDIYAGEYVAVVGSNGSGKSTLLKHINALLLPAKGSVTISGRETTIPENIRDIRKEIGMVFQVPESQIVGTIVEEDVAFGPENIGVPENELHERVSWALKTVGLEALRNRGSHMLSSGQKQLLAVAAALALKPRCLLLDEATSMLDPGARGRLIQTVERLHAKGITLITATHSMEEAIRAGRIIGLSEGRIVFDGAPRSVFHPGINLREYGLDLPVVSQIAREVARLVDGFPVTVLTVSELIDAVKRYAGSGAG